MEKESPKKARGRPPVGPPVTVAIGPDLMAAVHRYRADNFDARPLSATIRELLECGYKVATRGKNEPDDAWLEGPAAVPIKGATKQQLLAAMGISAKDLQRLIREGRVPVVATKHRTGSWFNLPDVFGALLANPVTDDINDLKRRRLQGQLAKFEREEQLASGELVTRDEVKRAYAANAAMFKQALDAVPLTVAAHADLKIVAVVRSALDDAFEEFCGSLSDDSTGRDRDQKNEQDEFG